jgi:ribosomal protein L10
MANTTTLQTTQADLRAAFCEGVQAAEALRRAGDRAGFRAQVARNQIIKAAIDQQHKELVVRLYGPQAAY